ncbi:hypothetical protein AcV7_004034 [Taiwanofungus camphoratus]|nr:hypothetical protein AcV7_004034 [Antrodia cinnamomea]
MRTCSPCSNTCSPSLTACLPSPAMPFQRYLEPYDDDDDGDGDGDGDGALAASAFSTHVHFQVPHLILGAPTLASGGGAEVLNPGVFASLASPWLPHSPKQPDDDGSHHISYPPPHPIPFHPAPSPAYSFPSHPVPISMPFPVPSSSLGLPVYSASGFDLLSILAQVASRPHPKIVLGPVDLTCSFVVVDIRRYDAPIVYASPSFCQLTGYPEHEVLGRNCRFLQSPDGRVLPGEHRRYTAPEAVAYLRRCLAQDKECQTSIINYRKGGAAFINLVTVVPVPASPDAPDDIVYHVGFQVDLAEQPAAILQKLRDGSYIVDYSRRPSALSPALYTAAPRDWRAGATTGLSPELANLLQDPAFLSAVPLSPAATATASAAAPADKPGPDPFDGNRPLHLLLLAHAPDFVHVVSLKGAFLYVAPAVRRVLGYAPADLVGRSLAEFCHQADIVPLMRELKESSAGPGAHSDTGGGGSGSSGGPRAVDLLFRMQTRDGAFVWLECRGRLHVEPGKGRKAIILSGRVRSMPRLDWGPVDRAGGLAAPVPAHERPRSSDADLDSSGAAAGGGGEDERIELEREFWGLLSARGAFLFVGAAVRDVLGWGAGEVIGRGIGDFLGGPAPADARHALDDALARACAPEGVPETHSVACEMRRKDGAPVVVRVVLYRPQSGGDAPAAPPCPLVCQVKRADAAPVPAPHASRIVHPLPDSVFHELQIARGSSWQYELQQLKFANHRLQEEVAALEDTVRAAARPPPPPDPLRTAVSLPLELHELQYPAGLHPHGIHHHWSPHLVHYQHDVLPLAPNHLPMKRSWNASADGGPT